MKSVRSALQRSLSPNARTVAGRRSIAKDTLKRTPSIIKEHAGQGATDASTFYPSQLDPLEPFSDDLPREEDQGDADAVMEPVGAVVEVVNRDAFTTARKMFDEDLSASVAVLNLASDEEPAGGWLVSLSKTQEEALCYSSTLYTTLKPTYYPWPNLGPGSIAGVFSPGVVIFKNDLDNNCVDLQKGERRVVSVITVAAPRGPDLTDDEERFANEEDLEDLRGKIRLVYRMAGIHKQRYLVLGAMGCGAYGCPPRQVAEEMKAILLDSEFKNHFKRVVFAVYSKGGGGNHAVFEDVFKDVRV